MRGCEHPGLAFGTNEERLTRREREVAGLASGGASSREIAAKLVLSVRTVDNHLQNAYSKLGVTSRDELGGCCAAEQAPVLILDCSRRISSARRNE